MHSRLQLASWLTYALLGCTAAPTAPGVLPEGNNVLFVGNSLTYQNDLPGMVSALAKAGGVELQTGTLTLAGHALIDYVLDGSIQPIIANGARGGWKFIVMQQGPSTVPICRDTLVLAVQEIDRLGKQGNAKSVVMMAWPSQARSFDFPKVHESSQMAAVTVGAQFAPAGDAWLRALDGDPTLALYGPDGYHPAPLGTFLAALVLYEQVTGKDARDLPATAAIVGQGVAAAPATVRLLQRAAHTANERAFANPVPVWTPSIPPNPGIRC
jgi:hypothetical protein